MLRSVHGSTGFRLMRAAKLFERRISGLIRDAIPAEDSFPYLSLFPHIDRAGTRVTDVAARMGVSKQAASRLIQQAEERGQLEVLPDPTDGRARVVRFSDEGMALFAVGDRLVGRLQGHYATLMGRKKLKQLDELLDELIAALMEEHEDA